MGAETFLRSWRRNLDTWSLNGAMHNPPITTDRAETVDNRPEGRGRSSVLEQTVGSAVLPPNTPNQPLVLMREDQAEVL